MMAVKSEKHFLCVRVLSLVTPPLVFGLAALGWALAVMVDVFYFAFIVSDFSLVVTTKVFRSF